MKKFIIKTILFFAIIVIVDLCFGALGDYLQVHAKGGDTKALNDLVKKEKHDILILGSSRAHHHYDTPYLSEASGMDVYNAGYDGNGVILAYGILKMVLERYEPKLVLFDVEPSFDINVYEADNNNTRYLKFLKPYYKEDGIEQVFRDVSDEEWYKVQSGLIRNNTDIISKLMDNVKSQKPFDQGYVPIKGEMSTSKTSIGETLDVAQDPLKLKYIGELIELAAHNSLPIIFAASPKFGTVNSEVLEPVKKICQEKKIVFMDYYADEEFMMHPDWFKEPMHLNEQGARVYSQRIWNDIKDFVCRESQ